MNDRILAPEVRLIGADGSQLGVRRLPEALRTARDLGLDLVEVAPKVDPPLCKIMDYANYRDDQKRRRRGEDD
jgi:translation initiation factor IF-3